MKVFAYPRVSTEEQAKEGNSLSEQKERLAAYCKAMGWDDPVWYIDDGYSAKDIRRPKLSELLDDIKRSSEDGEEGVVITTKLDRLSRSLYDILSLMRYMEKYNFRYVSSSESFDTSTAAGRLTLQVLGMVAEFERERNSERVHENMLSLANKLKTGRTITRPCFGYDIIDGAYEVNLEEAILANKMADIIIEKGPRAAIKWTLQENVLTKEGNAWHEKVLREYFQRETLVGTFVYNKTYKKGTRIVTRPESEWVILENHHPAILHKEKFRKLKELYQERKTIGRRMHEDRYLLSGLVCCAHCGSKMNGKLNRSYSKKLDQENLHFKYVCDGYLKKAICFHHSVNRDELEDLLVSRIRHLAESAPGSVKLDVTKKPPLEKDEIKSQLAKIEKKFQKQIEAYEEELISKNDLKIAKQRVEEERKRLVSALNAFSSENDPEQAGVHKNAKRLLPDVVSTERLKVKHAIRQLIHRIEVEKSEIVKIIWSLP